MDKTQCNPSIDIILDDNIKKIVITKCCLTERVNYSLLDFSQIKNLSPSEIFSLLEKHITPPEIYDVSKYFNCEKTCFDREKINDIAITVSTYLCNLSCTMCRDKNSFQNSFKHVDELKELYFLILESLCLQKFYPLIKFTTKGEPFFFKKETIELIKRYPNQIFYIITNGTLIDNDVFQEIENGFFKNVGIILSVDSFTPDIYASIRRTSIATAQRVFDTAVKLNEFYKRGLISNFRVNLVFTEQNASIEEINSSTDFLNKNEMPFQYQYDVSRISQLKALPWLTDELKEKMHLVVPS